MRGSARGVDIYSVGKECARVVHSTERLWKEFVCRVNGEGRDPVHSRWSTYHGEMGRSWGRSAERTSQSGVPISRKKENEADRHVSKMRR